MTPFGEKIRLMRAEKGVTQKEMAKAIGVSPAYLSALEHGKRGSPAWPLVQKIIGYFNVIWDEADQLQALVQISNPRVTIDTSGLSPAATRLVNLLAERIRDLDAESLARMIALVPEAPDAPSGEDVPQPAERQRRDRQPKNRDRT